MQLETRRQERFEAEHCPIWLREEDTTLEARKIVQQYSSNAGAKGFEILWQLLSAFCCGGDRDIRSLGVRACETGLDSSQPVRCLRKLVCWRSAPLAVFQALTLALSLLPPPFGLLGLSIKALEEHLGTRVNLRLSVKVDKNWRRKKNSLKEYGYIS